MNALVVVPTYNERENLEKLAGLIRRQPGNLHILVVDDNSPDGTGQLADELSRRHPGEVRVLHRPAKQGLGRAYVAAFQLALTWPYDVIVQMDADLSHDPAYLPAMLEATRSHDLVLASRYRPGAGVVNWDGKRLMLSKMASRYARLVTGMPFTDATGGFKCWRREALESIGLDRVFATGYLFQIETTFRAFRLGYRIGEVPIVFYERDRGRSKINGGIVLEALFGVLKLRLASRRLQKPPIRAAAAKACANPE